MITGLRRPSKTKHVTLQRGTSEAESFASRREEFAKIAPFAFEKNKPKPLKKCLNLVPDSSVVELNEKKYELAPFNYEK